MTPTKRFRIQGITGSANEFKHTAIVQCRALKCASNISRCHCTAKRHWSR